MKSALLAKAALCVCPPVVVATTVASVPPVRHAVHRFTAAYEPKSAAKPSAPPCVPVDHQTFASQLPISDVPGVVEDGPPPSGFYSVPPSDTVTPTPPGTNYPPGTSIVTPSGGGSPPAVPEPAAWMTMVLGFGLVGAGLRYRQRSVVRSRQVALVEGGASVAAVGAGGSVFNGLTAVGALMTPAALNPAKASTKLAQLGSKAMHSSMLAKAAMCVCPPVAMAVGTAAVPPVRHAVYNATAPKPVRAFPAVATLPQGAPCVPVNVPTAAQEVRQGDRLAVMETTSNWPS